MGIGTIDRTPPPFFRQGLSAVTKLVLCSALALFLMAADNRFAVAQQLRAVVATALYYPQQALLVPVQAVAGAAAYLLGLQRALADAEVAKRELARQAERSLRVEQLLQENARLRSLLDLRPTLAVRSRAAQVLYEASDPYSRKVVIDRGTTAGVALGSPVVNETGVLGQVTRVFPLSSEVTLLIDKDAAIPVLNTRTLATQRGFGSAAVIGGALEMRFMAGNADVRPGDALTTSGVDGVYPPGLPVATVATVERKVDSGFARIVLRPVAHPDGVRHVLVLEPVGAQLPPKADLPPVDDAKAPPPAAKKGRAPMIMPRSAGQLLLPVNPLFVGFTLLVAFAVNLLPLGRVPLMPDIVALVLVFWNVHQSRRVGVGLAFLFGLVMDVHDSAVLGQHALAYTLLSYFAITIHRRLLWFTVPSQAVQILPLFFAAHAVSLVVRMIAGGMFPGWEVLLAPVFEALLWPIATWVLLAPQRRPPDPDENRPL